MLRLRHPCRAARSLLTIRMKVPVTLRYFLLLLLLLYSIWFDFVKYLLFVFNFSGMLTFVNGFYF